MKYFFEAKDEHNKLVRGAVDANSSQEALLALGRRQLQDIRLISSDITAVLRTDLDKLSDAAVQKRVNAEIAHQQTRTHLEGFLLSVLMVTRNNAALLLLAAACTGWGIRSGSWLRMLPGVLLLLYPYALLVWNRRHLDHYRELQRSMVLGEWQQARRMITALRARDNNNDSLKMDLDLREVRLDLHAGASLADVLPRLEPWRAKMAASPGAFAARLLSVYAAARNYPAYLDAARESLAAAPGDHNRRLEYAMAETRFGSISVARATLDTVDPALLTPVALKFLGWVKGTLLLAEGNTAAALPLLKETVVIYKEASDKTPVSLSILALATASLALALTRSGKKTEGQRLLKPVAQALRVALDPALQAQLETELGWTP